MKLKRSVKSYGSGGGRRMFESKLFSVFFWTHQYGTKTTIEIKNGDKEIHFDGKHNFKSDTSCLRQLSITEIKSMIIEIEKRAFEKGRSQKAKEIMDCLTNQ